MKALVVAYYFPPVGGGGVNRTLKVVRGLAAAGWEPIVLTVTRAAWVQDPALLSQVPRRAPVLRLPNPDWGRVAIRGAPRSAPAAAGGRLRRWLIPDLHVAWSALTVPVAAAMAVTRAVDLVYTSCPPYSAHAAGFAARVCGLPWVADFRDAWIECPTRLDFPPWRRRLELGMEQAVLRRADQVLFASEGAREAAVQRVAGLGARSETVLTGFDSADFPDSDAAPPAGRFELVHAGSVVTNHLCETLDRLLDALRSWVARDPGVAADVSVCFVGAEPELAERFDRAGLGSWVRVEPPAPRALLGVRLRRAHACLTLAAAAPYGSEPIPGKLFDAVGAGRPALALTPGGALARIVRARGLGYAVDPRNTERVVELLAGLRERVLRGEAIPGPSEESRRALSNEHALARVLAVFERALADSRRRRKQRWTHPSPSVS